MNRPRSWFLFAQYQTEEGRLSGTREPYEEYKLTFCNIDRYIVERRLIRLGIDLGDALKSNHGWILDIDPPNRALKPRLGAANFSDEWVIHAE